MLDENGAPREPYREYCQWLDGVEAPVLRRKARDAERVFRRTGITFNVYSQAEADERLIPFDQVPRIISAREWARLSKGIEQRVKALNAFLHDIYHDQDIIRAGRVPISLIANNEAYLAKMIGVEPPGGVYTHIVGVDLVRTGADEFFVLEDNARTPSGVSYMLENRETMLNMFPELFSRTRIEPVSDYPVRLRRSLSQCAPPACEGRPVVGVLTPGLHNSAYYEHAFLAEQMGAELVEGHDLRVIDGRVAMRTTRGYTPIDVLYRRVDDDFLDPLNFRPDSMLGVPGIFDVYRAGGITIANAPGTGVADDKALYSYMPDIVEFYTGKPAILQNVPTWRCSEPDSLAYVLDHLEELVVKEVQANSGPGSDATFSATLIVGGQIAGSEPRLFLIYPEGNFIEASAENPFFQTGETKYGRPILLRGYDKAMGFEEAIRLLCLSFDSTLKANLSVGMPLDVQVYERDSFRLGTSRRIEHDDAQFSDLADRWGAALRSAIDSLPPYKL